MRQVAGWILVTALTAIIVVSVVGIGSAFAQEPETPPEASTPADQPERDGRGLRWGCGVHWRSGVGAEALATALGITVEKLEAAQQEARAAALQQAVEQGLITQEQADRLQNREGRRGPRFHGCLAHGIDYNALLAQALGISEEQLDAAKDTARDTALADAVAAGTLTQEQADLIQGRAALADYIDRDAIIAQALGMTVEELDAARSDGQRLDDIAEARGLDVETVRTALEAGYEEAVQRAVSEGVITQTQADQLQSGAGFGRGCGFGRGLRGPRGEFEVPATVEPVLSGA